LFEEPRKKLAEHFDVEYWTGEERPSRSEFLQRVAGKDALVCLLTEKIDRETLDAMRLFGKAAEKARSVNALAFTIGTNIEFDAGQYDPESERWRDLLAHELAHVVQQSGDTAAAPGEPTVTERYVTVFDAAGRYREAGVPLAVIAGKEYGSGSSRDWAAKGPSLLGVRFVIAESYERIHRSNLVGMGVLPLQFKEGTTAQTLKLDGTETYDIVGLDANIKPQQDLTLKITRKDGSVENVNVRCRIDTPIEIDYYQHGGILPYVLRQLVEKA
jgi:hypothetical protein